MDSGIGGTCVCVFWIKLGTSFNLKFSLDSGVWDGFYKGDSLYLCNVM